MRRWRVAGSGRYSRDVSNRYGDTQYSYNTKKRVYTTEEACQISYRKRMRTSGTPMRYLHITSCLPAYTTLNDALAATIQVLPSEARAKLATSVHKQLEPKSNMPVPHITWNGALLQRAALVELLRCTPPTPAERDLMRTSPLSYLYRLSPSEIIGHVLAPSFEWCDNVARIMLERTLRVRLLTLTHEGVGTTQCRLDCDAIHGPTFSPDYYVFMLRKQSSWMPVTVCGFRCCTYETIPEVVRVLGHKCYPHSRIPYQHLCSVCLSDNVLLETGPSTPSTSDDDECAWD